MIKQTYYPFKRKRKLSDGRLYVIETDNKQSFDEWMSRLDTEEKKIKKGKAK